MKVLEAVYDKEYWGQFLAHLNDKPKSALDRIAIACTKKVIANEYNVNLNFPAPTYKKIKKYRNDKPRDVYFYPEPYQTILKFINWRLNKDKDYTGKFSKSAVAYLPRRNAGRCVKQIKQWFEEGYIYFFKTDFSNYFNSINADLLIIELVKFFKNDPELLDFFIALLKDPQVKVENKITRCSQKGALAGTPLSGQWANIFMNDVDHVMQEKSIRYVRYADDVLILAKDPTALQTHVARFESLVNAKKINLSAHKTYFGSGQVVFLGFEINKDKIDISEKALNKLKSSMRRRSNWFSYAHDHSMRQIQKNRIVYLYIKGINKKIFTREASDDRAWLEWYTSALTTTESLEKLENYYLKQINKLMGCKNYKQYRKLGYRSIINEYYKLKKEMQKNKGYGLTY